MCALFLGIGALASAAASAGFAISRSGDMKTKKMLSDLPCETVSTMMKKSRRVPIYGWIQAQVDGKIVTSPYLNQSYGQKFVALKPEIKDDMHYLVK